MKKAIKPKLKYTVLRHTASVLFLIVVATPVMADDLATRIYKVSGMQSQLESMSAAFDQGFGQFANNVPQKTLDDLIKIGKDAFHEPAMGKIIVAHLAENMTDDQMKKVLDWHTTKIAKKITQLENEAATPEGQKKLLAYAQQLSTQQPEQTYIAQIQKLAIASKSIDLAVEIASNMQFSMGAGMAMATSGDKAVDLDAIAAQIEKAKPQLQQQLSQYIFITMLYTYKDLSKQELTRYIEFANSPTGSKFYTAMFGGIDKAFVKVGKQYGKALGEYFEQDAKQSES
ncbi:MAG: DUF2059 domain-containing protein [Gammaproteobacteria bacterium]|jgi:hypothetical protein